MTKITPEHLARNAIVYVSILAPSSRQQPRAALGGERVGWWPIRLTIPIRRQFGIERLTVLSPLH